MELLFTGIRQVPPFQADEAKVIVSYTLLGFLPDFVQVYALVAGSGGPGTLVDTFDVKPPELQYDQVITLRAGTYYTIYLCPGTGPQESPDQKIDDQYFDIYCKGTSKNKFQFVLGCCQFRSAVRRGPIV